MFQINGMGEERRASRDRGCEEVEQTSEKVEVCLMHQDTTSSMSFCQQFLYVVAFFFGTNVVFIQKTLEGIHRCGCAGRT